MTCFKLNCSIKNNRNPIQQYHRMKRNIFLLTLTLLAGLRAAEAQAPMTLTLQQCVSLGMKSSRTLALSNDKIVLAAIKERETKDLIVPQMKAGLSYGRIDLMEPLVLSLSDAAKPIMIPTISKGNYQGTLSVGEPILMGLKYKYAVESANLMSRMALLDVKKDSEEIKFNLINAYFNLMKVEASEKVVSDNQADVQQHLKDLNNLQQQGMATQSDAVRWQLQLNNLQSVEQDLKDAAETAQMNLDILLGLPVNTSLQIDTTESMAAPASTDLPSFQLQGLQHRPDMQTQQLKIQVAQNNLKVAQNNVWPTVAIGGNLYYINPNDNPLPKSDAFILAGLASLSVNLNIGTLFTNKNTVQEQQLNLQSAKDMNAQMMDNAGMEINAQYISWQGSVAKMKLLQDAEQLSLENYKLANSRYKNNISPLSELVDAQNQYTQASINLAIGKIESSLSYYKLLKATGTL